MVLMWKEGSLLGQGNIEMRDEMLLVILAYLRLKRAFLLSPPEGF